MKLACLFSPWSTQLRGSLDLSGDPYDDPRGMTGSEIGFLRTAEELAALGHDVTAFTTSPTCERNGVHVRSWEDAKSVIGGETYTRYARLGKYTPDSDAKFDAVIAFNEPALLQDMGSKTLRVCEFWLNEFTFCPRDFEKHVDLFASPSEPHLEQVLTNQKWHRSETSPQNPNGFPVDIKPEQWIVNRLGCDPDRYPVTEKVPGRCIYCSSPDRGLHILLQEWPKIKRAVPHAHLKIFYRLDPFLRGFDSTPYFPPIEENRSRALYIEEALRRLDGKFDIEVVGSVSRNRLMREMCEAEVLAYPCNTLSWSEGFSCSTLEACAAGCVPVITDCDAMGEVYQSAAVISKKEDHDAWRKNMLLALAPKGGNGPGEFTREFAQKHTWRAHAERLADAIEARL